MLFYSFSQCCTWLINYQIQSFIQVKVWFQNRRMKWRHTHENRKNQVRQQQDKVKFDEQQLNEPKGDCSSATDEEEIESYCISSDDEIDVGIE